MKNILLTFFLLIAVSINAQTVTSVSDGDWSNPLTWDTGLPGINDNVVVNHKVVNNNNESIFSLVVNDTLINTNIIKIKNDLTMNGYIVDDGEFIFRGNGVKNINGDILFNNLRINTNSSVFVLDTIRVKRVLRLNKGDLNLTGFLILDGTDTTDSRIGSSKNGNINGVFRWKKYIDRCNNWSTYGVPFNSSLNQIGDSTENRMIFTGFPGSDYPTFSFVNAYFYDETIGNWVVPSSANDLIGREVGYFYWNSDTVYNSSGPGIPQNWTISLDGSIDFNLDFDFNVTYTDVYFDSSQDGWNLVSNPYPGTLNWDNSNWTKTNVDNATYTFNTCTQTYSTYIAGIGTNGGNKWIPAGQGFFVHANSSSPSLICNQKVIKNRQEDLRKTGPSLIQIQKNNDESFVRIESNSTNSFDGNYDGYYYPGDSSSVYTKILTDSNYYSINSIPNIDTIQIYTKFKDSTNIYNNSNDFIIVKNENNNNLDTISPGNYITLGDTNLVFEHNYTIMPYLNPIVTSIETEENKDYVLYYNTNTIHTDLRGQLNIYNSIGKMVYSKRVNSEQTIINLTKGLYVVTINNKRLKFVY